MNLIIVLFLFLDFDSFSEDARFIKSCAQVKRLDFKGCYDTLKNLMIDFEEPSEKCLRLFGCVVSKLDPPLFEEGIESFNIIIKRNKNDFSAVFKLKIDDIYGIYL